MLVIQVSSIRVWKVIRCHLSGVKSLGCQQTFFIGAIRLTHTLFFFEVVEQANWFSETDRERMLFMSKQTHLIFAFRETAQFLRNQNLCCAWSDWIRPSEKRNVSARMRSKISAWKIALSLAKIKDARLPHEGISLRLSRGSNSLAWLPQRKIMCVSTWLLR